MNHFKIQIPKNAKSTDLIIISNNIANARYKLSLPTQKLLFLLISEIAFEERQNGKFVKEHIYSLNKIYDLFKEFRPNSNDAKDVLKKAFKELKENELYIHKIDKFNKEYIAKYPWYSKIVLDEKNNSFHFKFNQDLADLFLIKTNYFKAIFKEYLYLKGDYSIDLYNLLRAEEYANPKKKYPLEILKEKLGVKENKGYNRWADFKNYVLTKSIDQLNKNTNYIFSFDIERVGRRVGFVIFQVFNKKHVKALSNYITSKMELHFSKQENHIKALFESQKLNQLLYYYDPIKEHLTLSLENTHIQSKEQIEPLQSLFSEIDVHKKVLSNIFRKGTTLSFELSVTPWEQFIGETKNVFDRLIEKCRLSHKQAYAVIMKHELSEIREKLKEKLMFHQKGVLKKYEWDKGIINPIPNASGYIYSQVFEMKKETNL